MTATTIHPITQVIVVVPTSHLRGQWAKAANEYGIQLDDRFANGGNPLASDYDGTVVCYSTVANQPLLWRKLATAKPTIIILDEIHHAGEADHLSWGPALREAFDPAARRLLLSGTPFRSDKNRIPWVTYTPSGKCEPNFNYDYGTALADREVVRPVAFPSLDGTMRWRHAGTIATATLATVDETELAKALNTAYDPAGKWIESVLRQADEELSRVREDMPDAAGLLVAADQDLARAYAPLLEQITGERPTIAISDDPDASAHITRFAEGRSRWVIAVQMISEGVDIPRLAVGVYASRIATEMFFRQVVGRFVRLRSREDTTTATLFIPSIEPLLTFAAEIERTVDAVLAEQERRIRERAEKPDVQRVYDVVEPIDSSEAIHHLTYLSGEGFTDEELRRAQNAVRAANSRCDVREAALILRLGGAGKVVGTTTIAPPALGKTLSEEKAELRRTIKNKVGRLHYLTGADYAHINSDLNRSCGDTVATARIESLAKRSALLDQWIEGARP